MTSNVNSFYITTAYTFTSKPPRPVAPLLTLVMTASTKAALDHLHQVLPLEGWSIETKTDPTRQYRLLRRNVAVTDTFFLDIYHDASTHNVVGILTYPREGHSQAQVLVNSKGMLVGRNVQLVTISTWNPESISSSASRTFSSGSKNDTTHTNIDELTLEQNRKLVQYAAYAFAAIVMLKILTSALSVAFILLVPAAYLYAVQHCPPTESFDARQQLKRVLRGHHLSDADPNKPKGFLSETLARIQASVTAELATLPGYEVTMISMAGAAHVCCLRVPTVNRDFYWVGVLDNWYYMRSFELENGSKKRA
jgi:hypothetical protein